MLRRAWMIAGLLVGLALPAAGADRPAPPPTASEKELQAPLTLEDGKPTPAPAAEPATSGLRAFGSLVLVLGVAGGSLWALRKYGRGRLPGGGGSRLRVEETLALGDRRFVSILQADGARYLISLTPQGIGLLARMDPEFQDAPGGFAEALAEQVDLGRPLPVKEVEALLRQGGGQ